MDNIDWNAVEQKLKETQKKARTASTVDEAVDIYTAEMIAALKIMMSTAKVNGGTCTNGGPISNAVIS